MSQTAGMFCAIVSHSITNRKQAILWKERTRRPHAYSVTMIEARLRFTRAGAVVDVTLIPMPHRWASIAAGQFTTTVTGSGGKLSAGSTTRNL